MIFDQEDVNVRELGTLKTFTSREIASSPISIGFECLDRELYDPEKCYGPLGKSGVKWARCQTGWNRCETQRGIYDFSWLDSIVDGLLANGIQPWFNVGYGNRLYMDKLYSEAAVGYVPLYFGETALQAWQNYLHALGRHFKDRVSYFEIWNEANLPSFWQPRPPNPQDYATLIRLSAQILRQENPQAKIGGCITGSLDDYIIRFFSTGIGAELDFFCIHPYCVQPELNYSAACRMLRRTLDQHGGPHVELWQGEAGFASWLPATHWLKPYVLESERNQAVWMLRRFFTDFACGMSRSSFFMAVDIMGKEYRTGDYAQTAPARHGLLNGLTYTPKQAFHAMQHLTAIIQGDFHREDLYMSVVLDDALPRNQRQSRLMDMAVCQNTYVSHGYPFFEYHLAEDMQFGFPGLGGVRVTVEKNPRFKPLAHPLLVDLLTGKVYEPLQSLENESLLTLFPLPLTDYPLLVCDADAIQFILLDRLPNRQQETPQGYHIPAVGLLGGDKTPTDQGRTSVQPARCLRRPSSGRDTVQASLILRHAPTGPITMMVHGLDNEKQEATELNVQVNHQSIFTGPVPWKKDCWSQQTFLIPAGILHQGYNEITFRNITPESARCHPEISLEPWELQAWGWCMIDGVDIKLTTP